jgi:pimeloyl-ACP methyl ester carboxylesterase
METTLADMATAAVPGAARNGSLVALEVASRRPAWLDRLVLICTGDPMRVSDLLMTAARQDPSKAHEMIGAWSYTKGFRTPDGADARTRHLELTSHIPLDTLATDLRACTEYDGATISAASVAVPTVVVTAGDDRMVPPEYAKPIVDALADGTELVLPGVGHRVQWEAPEAVAAVLVAAATR